MTDYTTDDSKTSYNKVQIKDDNRCVCVTMMAKQTSAKYLLYARPLVDVISFNPQ